MSAAGTPAGSHLGDVRSTRGSPRELTAVVTREAGV
jgi:hypothetical protein